MIDFNEKLRADVGEKRYNHSVGVANAAIMLSKLYGEDEKKAYTAGILHDCGKLREISEQLKKCEEYNIVLTDIEKQILPVIHASLGAVMAKEEYGIEDEEILNAIRYHTVGREGMTRLDKIIYLSDMIEVNRDFKGVDKLREAAGRNLDEAILLSIRQSIEFNMKKQTLIHPNTIYMWNDTIKRQGDKNDGK